MRWALPIVLLLPVVGCNALLDWGSLDYGSGAGGSGTTTTTTTSGGQGGATCDVNGARNEQETDVDCGGPICNECDNLQRCLQASDCKSYVCAPSAEPDVRVCQAATCTDSVVNGEETDVDCGGGCLACAQGKVCAEPGDCTTRFCESNVCCGVSCSGRCQECAPGTGACEHIVGADAGDAHCPDQGNTNLCCNGLACPFGDCTQCHDLTHNGSETDTDCGGGFCAKCPAGSTCSEGVRDCASCVCDGDTCGAPRCGNGSKDGCETDVDCGGPCGPTCGNGQGCKAKSDCASFSCVEQQPGQWRCEGP